jgi:predicted RNase H-like nuclease (RuvC/YqgF family)
LVQKENDMSDLAEKFAEIEKRVKTLVAENRSHKKRVRELEKELGQTRHVAQKSVKVHDKQVHLRERIEKILRDLEGVEVKKG